MSIEQYLILFKPSSEQNKVHGHRNETMAAQSGLKEMLFEQNIFIQEIDCQVQKCIKVAKNGFDKSLFSPLSKS